MKVTLQIQTERLIKLMQWVGQHLGEVITLVVLGLSVLAGYLQLRWDVVARGKRLDKIEETLDDHVTSSTLHRTPDFEQAQAEIRADMVRINRKLDRILELLPRRP